MKKLIFIDQDRQRRIAVTVAQWTVGFVLLVALPAVANWRVVLNHAVKLF